jgi:heptosyltransferase II
VEYQKILVIQTAFLGDVILTTPTVKAIKQVFHYSQVDVLTIPQAAIVFKYNPYVNLTLIFDKKKVLKKIFNFWKIVKQLRKTKYDLAFSIQSSMTSSLVMFLGNIPNRIGFARQKQKLLTEPVIHNRRLHIRKRYLYLLKPFVKKYNDSSFDTQTEIFWSDSEKQRAQKIYSSIFEKDFSILGFAPGSVWQTKRWPTEYFIALLEMLSKEKIKILFFGGIEEQLLCQEIINKSLSNAVNLAGSLSVLESAALIKKIDLMISNDSAPLHIANAVQTDVVAIFGPTVKRFGCYPFRENDTLLEVDLYCRPCSKHGGLRCPEKHFRCMRDINPEMLYETIISKIGNK